MQQLEPIVKQAQDEITQATDLNTLDQVRVTYLGKKVK